ncbi:MAG: bifunctional UDP-sugar hydrolase/5'-nucleotidase [Deltaproteobacteria bacterium]|nr:bifunctional UDP-sugar hydrolase/5'-nucleotidase [Deltaproteobacteria bacterium]
MRPARLALAALLLSVPGPIGCTTPTPSPTPPAATTTTPTPPPTTTTTTPARAFDLHIVFTADEHGWILPFKDKPAGVWRGGVHAAASTMKAEGYAKGASGWLLLSAGDMWTGPYESTVLEGAPMAAAMKHLGYSAAAVGNHEFDFGTRVLAERQKGAGFPFLASNIIEQSTGKLPSWARPFTVVDVPIEGGTVKVGVLGLGCVESPVTADVRHMVGLQFLPYAQTLKRWLPELKAEKPDVVVVLAHDSIHSLEPLVPILRAHGIHAMAAGHEHRASVVVDENDSPDADDDVILCNGGPYLRSFCRLDLSFDGGKLVKHEQKIVLVERPIEGPAVVFDERIKEIVDGAEESAAHIGGEVLVDNKQKLGRGRDGSLGQLVVDAWLEALPYAQVALTNAGGLRQDIEAGPLRLRDVVSALPFNNYLLVVDMTGAELKVVLENPESVVGGMTFHYHDEVASRRVVTRLIDRDGKEIADGQKIKVIINDFMYRGGDKYRFDDREPEETAVDWREPIFRLLRDMGQKGTPLNRGPGSRGIRE